MSLEDELDRLLLVPGPTPVGEEIRRALSQPTISHTSAALAGIIQECQEGLQRVAGSSSALPFVLGGSGTLAQEVAVVNLVPPGGRLLVVSNGFFGDRFADLAGAHGVQVDTLKAQWGSAVSPEQVREKLEERGFEAITVTHVDTSTGVTAPVAEIAAEARRAGVPVILDSVCALGGMPVEMDAWQIDVMISGAQKALGVPPGLALVLVSDTALERRRQLGRISAYYADLLNWEASMRDPRVYFSTHSVNLFYGLKAGLSIALEEGLEERFSRHLRLAAGFREGMQAYGFSSLTREAHLAPTLSVLAYPDGVDDLQFRERLAERGVVAAGCFGEFKGRGLRFGHMGNISDGEIERALTAVRQALPLRPA
jgi:aspartate aminotransferase-like enzyme